MFERNNGNDHRAAAIDLQAEQAARPAAPCASYCYHAIAESRFDVGVTYVEAIHVASSWIVND